MKINAITSTNYLNQQQKTFKGLWGERKFLSNESFGDIDCDYYELKYHPFNNENEESIKKAIGTKQTNYNKKAQEKVCSYPNLPNIIVSYENTRVRRGKVLDITEGECRKLADALNIKMPTTLNEMNVLRQISKKLIKNA